MPSLENISSQAIALEAVGRLRDNFRVAAKFVEDPQVTISLAETYRQSEKERGIKPESDVLSRHQAKIDLLLNIEKYISLQKELNELAEEICTFNSPDDAAGDALLLRVLGTGRKTEAWSAHITNCLNVIKGTDKKILHPNGPAI